MIKVVIIEDEIPARNKLKRFISELEKPVEIVSEISTVEEAIAFLKNSAVDLIFSDIELLDGNAFEIYDQVNISCPVIFTTAYDSFWMNAFESNGIEYLLKPFSQSRFQKAWDKFILLGNTASEPEDVLVKLQQMLNNSPVEKNYKKRFSVSSHQGIYFINTEDITFFEAEEGIVFAFDTAGKKHVLNESTLKEIETQLNASDFFRINRSALVQKKYIERIERYNKNTLSAQIKGQKDHLITSQSNTSAFRKWIEE
ncbi:LytTR family DNA-binding domain-containing protein [Chryseobacterium culicis]|uniref:DNA-binding response regulator n=1 Tax=Chryseobacterium culicis TaxID=680127 RepID=A0A2S9CWV4_CHRCI|nr:LytTR family DNA-binding domain-containing protein [Chryseobacterium culicis]PRB84954.1 DNA-binding response regulator [Chryseobacterium culicis]PRB91322.1 DNA-binding response regulator [Chryseobacterium culicis]